MSSEISQTLVLLTAGVFVLGWILGMISSRMGARFRVSKRDSRDDRIHSLEAEMRIAQTNVLRSTTNIELLKKDIQKRDSVITQQLQCADELKNDLRDSVRKTRELRIELSDRAVEIIKSEAKLREVEIELSVAHAPMDMFGSGLLDIANAREQFADASQEKTTP